MPKKSEIRCKESMHEIRVDWFYKNSNFSCLQWGMLSQKRSGKLDAKEKIYDTEIFPKLEWQKKDTLFYGPTFSDNSRKNHKRKIFPILKLQWVNMDNLLH